MSAAAVTPPQVDVTPTGPKEETHLNSSYGLKSWLLTQDHKRIALMAFCPTA